MSAAPAGAVTLALSTSSRRGSVVIARAGSVLAEVSYEGVERHAERIVPAIDEALGASGLSRRELSAIACDVGPGSFTGARVGVATARGIALALGVPLSGVGSLEAMAVEGLAADEAQHACVAIALLDARRGELYAAAYSDGKSGYVGRDPRLISWSAAGEFVREIAVEAFGPTFVARGELGARLVIVGEVATELSGELGPRWVAAVRRDRFSDLPHARAVARIAAARLERTNATVDRTAAALALHVEPVYVREADVSLPRPRANGGERSG